MCAMIPNSTRPVLFAAERETEESRSRERGHINSSAERGCNSHASDYKPEAPAKEIASLAPQACLARPPGLCRDGQHVDPTTFTVELDHAVNQRKESIILPLTDAAAGVKPIADLPDQDIAGDHLLAAKSLDATLLRLRIATV